MNEAERELKLLWKEVFQDSDEFLSLFFEQKNKLNYPVFQAEGGRIVSALHLLPYDFFLKEKRIPLEYLYAAATLREARGKGHMAHLLEKSFRESRERGAVLSALLPAEESLYGYYKKFGYDSVFFRRTISVPLVHGDKNSISFSGEAELLWESYCRMADKLPGVLKQNKDSFLFALEMNRLYDGDALAILDDGQLTGHLICEEKLGTLQAQELFFQSEKKEALCASLAACFPQAKTLCAAGCQAEFLQKEPFGMLRILDVAKFLEAFSEQAPHYQFTVSVKDSIFSDNCGTFAVKDGTCKRAESVACPSFEVGIETLPSLLLMRLEGMEPYMSLMLS